MLPGTGQLVNGQRRKGYLFVGIYVICFALSYFISPIPMYLLVVATLIDTVIVGIQIIRGDREKPKGKRYIIEPLIVLLFLGTTLSIIDYSIEKKAMISLNKLLSGTNELSPKKKTELKKEAEAYLKDRYGKEFYVDKIEYIRQSPRYTMRGHLKDDEQSNGFYISKDSKGKYVDSYFSHVLADEGMKEIRPTMEQVFTSMMNWESTVTVAPTVKEKMITEKRNYLEIRQQTDRYQQQVMVNISAKLTNENAQEKMDEAYQLIEYLNQKGINASLEITYYKPSLKKKGVKKVDFTNEIQYGEYVTGYLEINDISEIQSVADVDKYLEIY